MVLEKGTVLPAMDKEAFKKRITLLILVRERLLTKRPRDAIYVMERVKRIADIVRAMGGFLIKNI